MRHEREPPPKILRKLNFFVPIESSPEAVFRMRQLLDIWEEPTVLRFIFSPNAHIAQLQEGKILTLQKEETHWRATLVQWPV